MFVASLLLAAVLTAGTQYVYLPDLIVPPGLRLIAEDGAGRPVDAVEVVFRPLRVAAATDKVRLVAVDSPHNVMVIGASALKGRESGLLPVLPDDGAVRAARALFEGKTAYFFGGGGLAPKCYAGGGALSASMYTLRIEHIMRISGSIPDIRPLTPGPRPPLRDPLIAIVAIITSPRQDGLCGRLSVARRDLADLQQTLSANPLERVHPDWPASTRDAIWAWGVPSECAPRGGVMRAASWSYGDAGRFSHHAEFQGDRLINWSSASPP